MSFHLILFLAFGAVCVGGSVNLLAQRHPINSALSLIAVMAALAGEYLLLGAGFVAALQVIVFGGAIMVLFVLVIMFQIGHPVSESGSQRAHAGEPGSNSLWDPRNADRECAGGLGRVAAFGNWRR